MHRRIVAFLLSGLFTCLLGSLWAPPVLAAPDPLSLSSAWPTGGVHDRGPRTHARGMVSGSTYWVMYGDTIYSISNRFGVSQSALMQANGIRHPHHLLAGTDITIPGLGAGPSSPSVCTPNLTIVTPVAGATVPTTFTVSGRGCAQANGTVGGNVVVRAVNAAGVLLHERVTILQGATVANGGEGTFAAQLTVAAPVGTTGFVTAAFAGGTAYAVVPVVYGSALPSCVTPYVTIGNPTSGANLPTTFTVSGRGCGLVGGSVLVRALDSAGRVLQERSVPLVANTAGVSGDASYSTQLTVGLPAGSTGMISVTSPGTTAVATVPVVYGGPTPTRFLRIDTPPANAVLPATFVVSGRGAGLFEGNVVVRARNDGGVIFQEVPTTLQGPNVGAGGEGSWSVTLTVVAVTAGVIEAYNSESGLSTQINVAFNGYINGGPSSSSGSFWDFPDNRCVVVPRPGAATYLNPGGSQFGQVPGSGSYVVQRGVYNGEYWFAVELTAGVGSSIVYLREADLTTVPSICLR